MENETNKDMNSELNIVEVEISPKKRVRRKHRSSGKKGSGSSEHSSHHSHHSHHSSHHHRSSRKSRSDKKKMKVWQKLLIALVSLILTVALASAGTFLYLRANGKREFTENNYSITAPESLPAKLRDDGNTVVYNGKTYEYKKDAINILFMGIDDYGTDTEEREIGDEHRADVIILMTIDLNENKMTLVNIPRDIITDVTVFSRTGGYSGIEKLPLAISYSYGDGKHTSCINTLECVRKIFYNIPINSYLSMEVSGIPVINDSIGGVDVKCPEDLYTSSGEIIMSKGEEYHLEGDDARTFVMSRRRDTPEANLLRNERQKIYLSSFMSKVIKQSKSDFSTPLKLYDDAEPYSCTNISASRITFLASELVGKDNLKTDTKTVPVTVTAVEDHAENYIKDKDFYELFLNVFYKEVKE